MLKINGVSKTYNTSEGEPVRAVNDLTLEFKDTGLVFILGKSGCGKTTLINMLSGLDMPDEGEIIYNEKSLKSLDLSEWSKFRNINIGVIFQEFNLIEEWSVYENVVLPLDIQNIEKDAEKKYRVIEALKYVELEHTMNRKVKELSGGQRQRIAIARTLVKMPHIILADEPTGNLDEKNSEKIFDILKHISKSKLVIVVTHDEKTAREYGDKIIRLSDGQEIGNQEVVHKVRTKHTNNIHIENLVDGKIYEEEDLTDKELFEYIERLVRGGEDNQKYKLVYDRKKPNEAKELQPRYENTDENASVRSLGGKKIFQLCKHNLKMRKVRLAITTLLFALTLLMLIIINTVSNYDESVSINSYIKKYNPEFSYLKRDVVHTDTFFRENERSIRSGRELRDILIGIAGEENVVGVKEEITIFNDRKLWDTIKPVGISNAKAYVIDESYQHEMLKGDMPKMANEIAITDYAALLLGADNTELGKMIYLNNEQFILTGIVKTDYIERNFEEKVRLNYPPEYVMYEGGRIYKVAYLSTSYIEGLRGNRMSLQIILGDFSLCEHEASYTNSLLSYGNIDWAANPEAGLIAGRLPEKENEVVIYTHLADKIQDIQGVSPMVSSDFRYIDLDEERFNGAFSDYINMIEYFPEGVEVVGIYGYDMEFSLGATRSEVLLHPDKFEQLADEYYYALVYDGFAVLPQGIDSVEDIRDFHKNNLQFENPSIDRIYSFDEKIEKAKELIIITLIIVALITYLMIASHIGGSIKDSSRKIGILFSLGVTKKDIMKIFVLETMIISIIAYVVALIMSIPFIVKANNIFKETLPQDPFNILYINKGGLLVVLAVTLIIGIVSTISPIRSFAKKKPIEVIKGM